MATPRSPFVAIGDALLDEPWPYDLKAALVMLSCHMHARWRADRRLSLEQVAENHPVSMPDLMKITGKGRRDVALKSAERLAEVASMSAELRGDVLWIKWPKWAEYNRRNSRSQGGSWAPPKPKPKPKPNRKKKKSGARPTSGPPSELSPGDYERVRAHFQLISPGCVALDLDQRIENSLLYFQREGLEYADYAAAVMNNITALENRERKRNGEPPLRSVREAREIQKARAKSNGDGDQQGLGV